MLQHQNIKIMKPSFYFSTILLAVVISVSAFKPVGKTENANSATSVIKAPAATKWTVDKAHSSVKFTVTHMVISEVEGTFKVFEGSLENAKDDFSDAKINFSIDVNSVNTDNENRDKHLKSDDFFNAEKFPAMKFEGTSLVPAGNNKYKLNGNLTIRDVTKPVSFDVSFGGIAKTQRGNKAGFKATTTINRFDYNLKWSAATETGGLVVSKEVAVTVNVELNEVK
jgi:polyisoprenoid-binding protein YceI